jgi:hypothetical protein
LPPLPPVALPTFSDAFYAKLKQCSVRCRWFNPAADLEAKEIKTNDLHEIFKLCEIPSSFRRLSPAHWVAVLEMIASNVHRPLPPLAATLQMTEELPTSSDPEWPHLMIVYDILRRAHTIAPQSPGFTIALFKQLLDQVGSPDSRENDQLCGFATDFVAAHPRQLAESLDALAAALLVWSDTPNLVFAVNAAVTIYGSVLRAHGRSSVPTKRFFYAMVLPQLTSVSFVAFAKPFVSVVQTFVGSHPRAAVRLVQRITEFWPQTRSAKEIFFLRLLAIALPHAAQRCPAGVLHRLFAILAECLASPVVRVAETAFQILGEAGVDAVVKQNAVAVLPLLMPAVNRALKSHWAGEIREAAQATLLIFSRIDSRLTKEELPSPVECAPGQVWARIVHMVHRSGEDINVSGALSQIMSVYGGMAKASSRRQSAWSVAPKLPR